MPTRRHFLASSLFALAPTVPEFLARTALAAPAGTDRRVLVVVQLDGGNDALNTVVPHADPEYARLRPKLKLARKDLITVTDVVGLHPALKPLDKLLTAGCLSVLPGVGYPNPNRSHFESMAIWHTAQLDPEERAAYGWIGKALDPSAGRSFVIGGAVPGALRGRRSSAISLSTINDVVLADPTAAREQAPSESVDDLLAFVRRQATDAHAAAERLAKVAGVADNASYPGTALASHLKLVARLLKADLGSRVFYTVQGGYDTHAAQAFTHDTQLSEFGGAVAAFFADLQAAKLADRVTLMAFSEFGRTVKENGSGGTDHGTAGAVFVVGRAVKGGLASRMPSLTDLAAGEPRITTDFRQIYAAVLHDWLELPTDNLRGSSPRLPLFNG